MNKYSKEFLMRIVNKVEDPITRTYILCINDLLEYDFEYLEKNNVIPYNFYRALKAIAEVTKDYDYVKDVFDMIVEKGKRGREYIEYSRLMEEIISILIKEDKDKYEEYILNKLFGNAWKDSDFFLPKKNFLGLPDRFPTLEDLLFRNTTFSDNISEELSKKIINGFKILYETIPKLINKYLYYEEGSAFPECSVSKYIKQDLKLKQSCKMENSIDVEILTDHIRVIKYIHLREEKGKYQDYLAEKITQYVSKIPAIIAVDSHWVQELVIQKEERINLPANFIL